MFTGIIEEMGEVAGFQRKGRVAVLTIGSAGLIASLNAADSICVDGTCLTVVSSDRKSFDAEISSETIQKSTIGSFRKGRAVNLERPLSPGGRMGGHLVQGHIDTVIEAVSMKRQRDYATLVVSIPRELSKYVVLKGSIALNGVSLTVAEKRDQAVSVALIPTTLRETNLGKCRAGDRLNLEVDIIGKYVKSFVDVYRS